MIFEIEGRLVHFEPVTYIIPTKYQMFNTGRHRGLLIFDEDDVHFERAYVLCDCYKIPHTLEEFETVNREYHRSYVSDRTLKIL